MLGLKLIHVSKSGPSTLKHITKSYYISPETKQNQKQAKDPNNKITICFGDEVGIKTKLSS